MRPLFWLLAAVLVFLPSVASAQMIPLVTSTPMANGDTEYALGIQILMVMTVLTLLPAMLITMTAFTRILIVLAILRQALGTAQTPSNQIILGLSLFLTLFIMSPVIDLVWAQALSPFLGRFRRIVRVRLPRFHVPNLAMSSPPMRRFLNS